LVGFTWATPETEDGFGPLDDFGEADSGCTEIKYKKGNARVAL